MKQIRSNKWLGILISLLILVILGGVYFQHHNKMDAIRIGVLFPLTGDAA